MTAQIKKTLAALLCLAGLGSAHAAGGGPLPYSFEPDMGNEASLQRGARHYMAYCAGCHSMSLMRYSRIGSDLNIPEDLLGMLMVNTDKPGDTIVAGMPGSSSAWFGQKPPDLTLTSRARGPSWVYSYLLSFYLDDSRPLGVNNTVLAGASMPHVLWELQGWQVKEETAKDDGHGGKGSGLKLVTEGSLSPAEYERFVGDIVNFMAYAAEPGRLGRVGLGMKVMLFLLLFTFLAWLLKREYWKDVH
jgi:ubiquinol-cytochrome c reductase cytochrome c1 subunit